ncbi:MAG: DUF4363 family protein [Bacillota bacterium]|jgi:hypothetical protein
MAYFDRSSTRYWIGLVWITGFLLTVLIFNLFLTSAAQGIEKNLGELEANVSQRDWSAAKQNIQELESIWQKKRFWVQVNNGTEIFYNFKQLLGEAKTQILNEEPGALQPIGGMRQLSPVITSVFAGP